MSEVATKQAPGGSAEPGTTDGALLQAAALSAARRDVTWMPRPLTPPVRALLWALRLYVVLMLAVVVVQLTRLGG